MLMNDDQTRYESWQHLLLRAAHEMSLSAAQYSTIRARYDQLQGILSASDHPLLQGAHIFVQGSIRLQTTIKPVPEAPGEMNTVDADAVVWLPHAQGASADEVLAVIEQRFQEGSRVQQAIQPLRRGIRIVYADEAPSFHIDVTPARAKAGNARDNGEGMLEVPDRHTGWKASSPIPYAQWLAAVSEQEVTILESVALNRRAIIFDAATQDPMPAYEDYMEQDPLRATIKLLKRHRDEWAIRTHHEAVRPISAVITTLATQAYLEVVKASRLQPITPLDAIVQIVRRMASFIGFDGGNAYVLNPADAGENFAEKWNRPQEGQHYRDAFYRWHEEACDAVVLGLQDAGSADAFAEAFKRSFGIGPTFIRGVNNELPANWTLPGRAAGMTRNAMLMGSLFGASTASAHSQASATPVGRLG